MSHSTCCVVDCTNNGKNSKCKFYSFPRAQSKIDQREKWITAVRRINPDGSPWQPKLSHSICSAHFIKNEKSNDPLNPSYVPTIFPVVYKKKAVNIVSKISRHTRFKKKREKRKIQEASLYIMEAETEHLHKEMQEKMNEASDSTKAGSKALKYKNEESQVNIAFDVTVSQQTFICNRYMYTKAYGDAETQTDIDIASKIIVPSQKKCHDKKYGTPHKNYVDQSLGPIFKETSVRTFSGFSSVKNDKQLLGLAGVTRENFNTLLSMCCTSNDAWKVLKKDRLLIFLIKMKTGLTFSAIIVLFGVHRVTISRIFFSILQELYSATADMVLWPEKHIVKATVPQCFYPDYIDTRVIIDCTEFRIEVPPGVDNKVFSYLHYKKGFTAKVLIGITPAGFISFKSKVAGGRKSDSQLTIESGLIDLLEDEDKVLADKGFTEIKQVLSETGKNITVVMPPFLENKEQFNQQQTEATYSISSVRIHVERIMQRLKTYQILNKIPVKLFNYIDAILHICCVLVNLQPPIISNHTDDNK